MRKEVVVLCSSCNDIPINRECYCKKIAVNKEQNIINIFSDSLDDFEFCIGYFDDNNKINEITKVPDTALGGVVLHKDDTTCLKNFIQNKGYPCEL